MANARAIEPVAVATQRKQQNREHMANTRAIEPVAVATQRKQHPITDYYHHFINNFKNIQHSTCFQKFNFVSLALFLLYYPPYPKQPFI